MSSELPEYLYKYRPVNIERLRRIVEAGMIYFSSPMHFNDPFDCSICFDHSGTKKEWIKKLSSLIKRNRPSLNRKQRTTLASQWYRERRHLNLSNIDDLSSIEEFGVFSMTEKEDNILMWSHYASDHKGVCLRFNVSSTCKYFGGAMKVTYSGSVPRRGVIGGKASRS